MLALALLLFLGGCLWSICEMGLDWSRLRWSAGVLALLLVVPSLWFNALELQLCARAAGHSLPASSALHYSNLATLSNLLPLPASIFVRGGAMMRAGASLASSGRILLMAGLIWLAMAGGISAMAILPQAEGIAAAVAALAVVALITAGIAKGAGLGTALSFVAVRVALLVLLVTRLYFCFAMFGAALPLPQVAVYTVTSILGSAAGIVPAGLGVSEGIAAALAALVGASPAAAFLSVGLNRLLGLIGSALVVLGFVGKRPAASRA